MSPCRWLLNGRGILFTMSLYPPRPKRKRNHPARSYFFLPPFLPSPESCSSRNPPIPQVLFLTELPTPPDIHPTQFRPGKTTRFFRIAHPKKKLIHQKQTTKNVVTQKQKNRYQSHLLYSIKQEYPIRLRSIRPPPFTKIIPKKKNKIQTKQEEKTLNTNARPNRNGWKPLFIAEKPIACLLARDGQQKKRKIVVLVV